LTILTTFPSSKLLALFSVEKNISEYINLVKPILLQFIPGSSNPAASLIRLYTLKEVWQMLLVATLIHFYSP
jgi:hypothetical protein